jgi:hypothetical protein
MRETSLVGACIEYLTLRGCFVYRQNQGSVSAEYKGRKRYVRFAGVDGISDIVGMTPAGQYLAVECKVRPNRPTTDQENFLARVRQGGGVALLVYSIDELIAAMKQIGV